MANCTNIFADKVAGMPNVVLKMQGEDLSQAGWILPIALKRYHRSVVSGTIIALRAVPPVSL